MKIVLIRHGKTPGNVEKRYIGSRTDEGLDEAFLGELRDKAWPAVKRVFVSPMRRCIETARLIYPDYEYEAIDDFRECDFGAFEGKNYAELNGRADYQAWIDSGGELPFPDGERRSDFAARCVKAFEDNVMGISEDCALVVHGGTIMAIMEKYARPQGSYFDFQVKNGCGFVLNDDGSYEKV